MIRCLMLIENETAENISKTRQKLEEAGLQIDELIVARSLSEAIKVINKTEVNVILLDLDLEDKHTAETVRILRALTNHVIIVLSDSKNETLGCDTIRAGADDFILKSMMTNTVLRSSIVNSVARHNIREVCCSIKEKFDKAGV